MRIERLLGSFATAKGLIAQVYRVTDRKKEVTYEIRVRRLVTTMSFDGAFALVSILTRDIVDTTNEKLQP